MNSHFNQQNNVIQYNGQKNNDDGFDNIVGIDEAGRGPLAGPVVAASVILKPYEIIEGIKDSKKLSPKKRDILYYEIYKKAISVGVGIVNEDVIDDINVLKATFLGMKKSLGNFTKEYNATLPVREVQMLRLRKNNSKILQL